MLWGETANKVTQGCLAGWWQVWDWTLLFCCSGGLGMKPGFVLVCWVCDHPACVNFTMALSNSKELGFCVSMHGHHQCYNKLSLIRKFNCIALTRTEKLETPIFPENTCIFRQHHCCSAERWRRDFTWVDVSFKNAKISCFTWRGTFSNREMGT